MSGPKAIPPASKSTEALPDVREKGKISVPVTSNQDSRFEEPGMKSEPRAELELELDPDPDLDPGGDELWMCPATGVTMPLHERGDYLSISPDYKECWQRVLASLVEKIGKRDVEKRVARLHRGGLCSAEEAFCALAESGGDIESAAEKLRTNAYRNEMALAARACELSKFVTTKRKKKKKKKKKKKAQINHGA
jgi:hypothetical protein